MKRPILISLALLLSATASAAQDMRLFSIGTGGTGATYYPLGGTIANAISNPPGSRPCDEGGSCGVAGLIAVAQSSKGSVDNVRGIVSGRFDSGFSQSDVAYWAYSGTGMFEGEPPLENLRIIAALYPEHIQLIARTDARIETVAGLRGKRVSLDEKGSGSYANALEILKFHGLTEGDIEAHYLKSVPAAEAIIADEIDAFFITAGYPTNAIIELAERADITLVPIGGENADMIVEAFPFYSRDTVPAGIYSGIGATETLAVGAQWLTSAEADPELIHAITEALWNEKSRTLLDVGHSKGAEVTLETALDGLAIPLHEGAARFYRAAGLLD
ncbi:TAXI family TRAP transporter solute-binding subunit [Defluviimonas sp. WL0002]|uniref:TAXI family TRAP transporter solute-binding subunit n=1 Tax=Albidovulum marisflavi TaxID=2984159 RepID=A0ABT2Z8L4_9RHOB|nr:TAXI family TRAP transporter solute-binding subunit [Defluviimonas sp. WL0002]MCV2867479.1 TAXI family TRAP transporter solute-binding subunit [Defluviimonas sp. WL0002]